MQYLLRLGRAPAATFGLDQFEDRPQQVNGWPAHSRSPRPAVWMLDSDRECWPANQSMWRGLVRSMCLWRGTNRDGRQLPRRSVTKLWVQIAGTIIAAIAGKTRAQGLRLRVRGNDVSYQTN